jgi:prepilin-type N-terminal cleavage/methylation domain-containing protein
MVSRRLLTSAGFSMVELLIAVAIMGIIALLGYPYVATYLQSAQLRAAAEELVTIVNGARQIAIARNTTVCVTLSDNAVTYTTGVSSGCAGGTLFTGAGTAADGTMRLQNSMQVTASTASVTFTSLGAAVPAGTYTVHNPNTGSNLSVVVSAAGRVSIQ